MKTSFHTKRPGLQPTMHDCMFEYWNLRENTQLHGDFMPQRPGMWIPDAYLRFGVTIWYVCCTSGGRKCRKEMFDKEQINDEKDTGRQEPQRMFVERLISFWTFTPTWKTKESIGNYRLWSAYNNTPHQSDLRHVPCLLSASLNITYAQWFVPLPHSKRVNGSCPGPGQCHIEK